MAILKPIVQFLSLVFNMMVIWTKQIYVAFVLFIEKLLTTTGCTLVFIIRQGVHPVLCAHKMWELYRNVVIDLTCVLRNRIVKIHGIPMCKSQFDSKERKTVRFAPDGAVNKEGDVAPPHDGTLKVGIASAQVVEVDEHDCNEVNMKSVTDLIQVDQLKGETSSPPIEMATDVMFKSVAPSSISDPVNNPTGQVVVLIQQLLKQEDGRSSMKITGKEGGNIHTEPLETEVTRWEAEHDDVNGDCSEEQDLPHLIGTALQLKEKPAIEILPIPITCGQNVNPRSYNDDFDKIIILEKGIAVKSEKKKKSRFGCSVLSTFTTECSVD